MMGSATSEKVGGGMMMRITGEEGGEVGGGMLSKVGGGMIMGATGEGGLEGAQTLGDATAGTGDTTTTAMKAATGTDIEPSWRLK